MIKKLITIGGNSIAIVVPKEYTRKCDLHPSDYVILEEKNGLIVLKKLLLGD
jgi:antitoxin component of MazEF toxin-antitoxin module